MHPENPFPLPPSISVAIAAFTSLFSLAFNINETASAYIGLFTLLAFLITSSLLISFLLFALPCILYTVLYEHFVNPPCRLAHRIIFTTFPQGLLMPLVPRAYDQLTLHWSMRLRERAAALNRRGSMALQQAVLSPVSQQNPQGEESVLDRLMRREADYAEKRLRILQLRERGELIYS